MTHHTSHEAGLFISMEEKEITTLQEYAAFLSRKTGVSCNWRKALDHLLSTARVEMGSEPPPSSAFQSELKNF